MSNDGEDLAERILALNHMVTLIASVVPAEAWANISDHVLLKHQEAKPPEPWLRHFEKLVEDAARLRRSS